MSAQDMSQATELYNNGATALTTKDYASALLLLKPLFENGFVIKIFTFFISFCGIAFVWFVSSALEMLSKTNFIRKWLAYFGKYSMDIYLLSYFVQTPFITIYNKIHLPSVLYPVWVIGLTVLAIAFSLIVSKYVIRKFKILKLLMLGESK